MAGKKTTAPEEQAPPENFEESLAHLETILDAMEHEQLPLEDLVTAYEKGSKLLNHCEAILKSARGRIELITLRNQNEIALDTEDEAAQGDSSTLTGQPDDSDTDDDIRLF